jgi:hypothetical protein
MPPQLPETDMSSQPKSQTQARPDVVQTPFCADLRSKKFYMLDVIPSTAEDFYDASGCVWCYHTQVPIGPDGLFVSPEECGPGRKCYRSALDPRPAPPSRY